MCSFDAELLSYALSFPFRWSPTKLKSTFATIWFEPYRWIHFRQKGQTQVRVLILIPCELWILWGWWYLCSALCHFTSFHDIGWWLAYCYPSHLGIWSLLEKGALGPLQPQARDLVCSIRCHHAGPSLVCTSRKDLRQLGDLWLRISVKPQSYPPFFPFSSQLCFLGFGFFCSWQSMKMN